MSFKPPRPPQNRSLPSTPTKKPSTLFSQNTTPIHHHLIPSLYVPKTRRGFRSQGTVRVRNNEVLAEPFGQTFVQQPGPSQTSTSTTVPPPEPALDDPFMDTGDVEPLENYVLIGGEAPELQRQRQQRKKERQWAKWANETIPSLLQPYFRILRESDNLRTLNRHSDVPLPACSCERRASINVTCVFFERKLFRLRRVWHLLIWYFRP